MQTMNDSIPKNTPQIRKLPRGRLLRLVLPLCLLLVACGKNISPINPTERVEGEITLYQEGSFSRYTIVKSPDGLVKRVYGQWGKIGETVIIENAKTF